MSVPGYQEFMFPILKLLSDNKIYYKKDIFVEMSKYFNLTSEQMEEKLPSQSEPTYINRIGWAITYLKKAGLVENPSRAHYVISQEGQKVVKDNVVNLNSKYLKKYDSFLDFQNLSNKKSLQKEGIEEVEDNALTPIEEIASAHEIIKNSVCDDLLKTILEHSPYTFEKIVVDLIVAMGYGGSNEEAGQATKKSGDEGIDGLVKEDKLGLETIYIQAKRYSKDNIVGRPAISQFLGDLQLKGARKGIFITTSDFSKQAIEAVERNKSNYSIILINGKELVELMYEYNVGVAIQKKIEIKRIDSDYFESI